MDLKSKPIIKTNKYNTNKYTPFKFVTKPDLNNDSNLTRTYYHSMVASKKHLKVCTELKLIINPMHMQVNM